MASHPSVQELHSYIKTQAVALGIGGKEAGSHTLPPLPYAYDALEPAICEEIMRLHHDKHHAAYVAGLNSAETQLVALQAAGDTQAQLGVLPALNFHGGGHINHTLFWTILAPTGSPETQRPVAGRFAEQVTKDFGSFESLIDKVNAKTAAIQGSGWGWLVGAERIPEGVADQQGWNAERKALEIVTAANQDPLTTHVPIIGIDIWEHAFYLQYKNVKADYLKHIWSVINWAEAERRFEAIGERQSAL